MPLAHPTPPPPVFPPGYTHERYREIIHSIRRYMPDASVSGDAIVGFPGETEEQFERTMALVEEVGFDRVNTGEGREGRGGEGRDGVASGSVCAGEPWLEEWAPAGGCGELEHEAAPHLRVLLSIV